MVDRPLELNRRLRFDPGDFTDPVPPFWVFEVLDRSVIRDLAVINLERMRGLADLNNKAIEQSIAVLKKAKF